MEVYELAPNVILVPVDQLNELPINKEIHADFDPHGADKLFVQDIAENGILLPLLIDDKRYIHNGSRRWNAAKVNKIRQVPCVILQEGETIAAYNSAQLGRNMSVFAKCVLRREALESLIARSKEGRAAKMNGDDDYDSVDEEWIFWEMALGLHRKTIKCGIKVLNDIDALKATGEPEDLDKAERVRLVFRNRGMKPAMRMLGEKVTADDDDEDNAPDCNKWGHEPPRKRSRPRAAVEKAVEVGEPGDDDEPSTVRIDDVAAWQADALYHLGELAGLLREHIGSDYEEWIATIRDHISDVSDLAVAA